MTVPVPAHGQPVDTEPGPVRYREVPPDIYQQTAAAQQADRLAAPPPPAGDDAQADAGDDGDDGEWVDDVQAEAGQRQQLVQPSPVSLAGPPPGWYPDPADPTIRRYWDGAGYVGEPHPIEDVPPERVLPDGAVAVRLTGKNGTDVVHILDPRDWPTDANADLRVGDYESWAQGCLVEPDYDEVWVRLAPTMGNVNDMFNEYRRVTGQDQGKSGRSMRSYRDMARRSKRT